MLFGGCRLWLRFLRLSDSSVGFLVVPLWQVWSFPDLALVLLAKYVLRYGSGLGAVSMVVQDEEGTKLVDTALP
jgi:hypothetical protein